MSTSERIPSIPAKPIAWLDELMSTPATLERLVEEFGSPLHLHRTEPFLDNVAALRAEAATSGLALGVYFARKANKALCYVEAAIDAGIGIDIASAEELDQALGCGADPERLVVTSAVKPDDVLATCLEAGVLVVIDNDDELDRYLDMARRAGRRPPVAVRLSHFEFEKGRAGPSRFGFDIGDPGLVAHLVGLDGALDLQGLHFHLDGYSASDRVDALGQTLDLGDELARAGVETSFIDIGGGFPVTYTDDLASWSGFWDSLEQALLGRGTPITYRNDGYGQIAVDGRVVGPRHAYPHHQTPTGGEWLRQILTAVPGTGGRKTIAERIAERGLELRCEPGRALLDGCGASVASVVHVKPLGDDTLVAVDMNSSNCRTQKSELLTDPLHLPTERSSAAPPCTGYITGAYCSESDLITRRRLRFARTPARGDLVVFPNTAGYYMHFTESRSHQFPLPPNVRATVDGWVVDLIDEGRWGASRPHWTCAGSGDDTDA